MYSDREQEFLLISYGDTKLYPSHQKILIAYLEEFPRKNIELVNFLKESSALDAIVYCVGD